MQEQDKDQAVKQREQFEALFSTIHYAGKSPAIRLFERVSDDRRYCSMEVEYAWLTFLSLISRIEQQAEALADMEARKDDAYYERNQVVAALAKCFPSGVARTAIEGWSEDWHGCVYIDLPTGQVSWHFHDSQAHLFDGLPQYAGKWDGHDTPEKYRRVNALEAHPTPAVDLGGLTNGKFVLMPRSPSEAVLQPDGWPRLEYARYQAMLDEGSKAVPQSLLSAPVVREGVLTDAKIEIIWHRVWMDAVKKGSERRTMVPFARAIEREVLATGKGEPFAYLARRKLLLNEWTDWEVTTKEAFDIRTRTPRPDIEVKAVYATPSTPSQAWNGELPELPMQDKSEWPGTRYYTDHTMQSYARKAIGAAFAGVAHKARALTLDYAAMHFDGLGATCGAYASDYLRSLKDAPMDTSVLSSNPVSLTEKDGWISVEERLPNQLRGVLVCHETNTDGVPDLSVAEGRLDPDGCWRVAATFYRMSGKPSKFELRETVAKVLYWKPLPEAAPHPASNGNGEKGGAA